MQSFYSQPPPPGPPPLLAWPSEVAWFLPWVVIAIGVCYIAFPFVRQFKLNKRLTSERTLTDRLIGMFGLFLFVLGIIDLVRSHDITKFVIH
jgi:hypothetical protein